MTDLQDETLDQIDKAVPGAVWEVLPGTGTPRQSICGRYPSIVKAVAALKDAGYQFSAHPVVPARCLSPSHDPRTVLSWTFKNALGVDLGLILVARIKGPIKA